MLRRRHGFTLVELLVVIVIIGMLAGLLLPAVQSAREAGRRTTCLNNQRQVAQATIAYTTAKDKFPGSWGKIIVTTGTTQTATAFEWPVLLLPNMGRNDIYNLIANPSSGGTPITAANAPQLTFYLCPSMPPPGTNNGGLANLQLNYAVNCGLQDVAPTGSAPFVAYDGQANGVFFNQWQPNWTTSTQALTTQTLSYIAKWDGASNTLLMSENMDAEEWMGENPPNSGAGAATQALNATEWEIGICWFDTDTPTIGLNQHGGMAMSDTTNQPYYARPSSKHPGGFVVAMCDGQAKFLSQDIVYNVYGRLMTPRGAGATLAGTSTVIQNTSGPNFGWPSPNWSAPISETDLNP